MEEIQKHIDEINNHIDYIKSNKDSDMETLSLLKDIQNRLQSIKGLAEDS